MAPLFIKEGLGKICVNDQDTKQLGWFSALEIPLSPPLVKGEAKCVALLKWVKLNAPLFIKEGLGEISVKNQDTKQLGWLSALEIPLSPPFVKGEAKCVALLKWVKLNCSPLYQRGLGGD